MINIVLLFVAANAAAFFLMWWLSQRRRQKLESLASQLGGEPVSHFLADDYVRLGQGPDEVRVRLIPGGKNQPNYLELQSRSPLGFNLSISRENRATRALERWGLLKEVKIGDPGFDEQYLVLSNDPAKAMMFLQGPGRREAMDYFSRQGFTALQAGKEAVAVRKPSYRETDLEPGLIRTHLEQLGRLAGKP
jgi:hypothetical protein